MVEDEDSEVFNEFINYTNLNCESYLIDVSGGHGGGFGGGI